MEFYKDPLFANNQTLMGFKGNSYMDSGYFYAPYVPMTQTPTVLDPNSFSSSKGILSQYGKKILNEGSVYKEDAPKPKKKKYRSIDDEWMPSKEDV